MLVDQSRYSGLIAFKQILTAQAVLVASTIVPVDGAQQRLSHGRCGESGCVPLHVVQIGHNGTWLTRPLCKDFPRP